MIGLLYSGMAIPSKSFKNFIIFNAKARMNYNNFLALKKAINESLDKMQKNIIINFLRI